MQDFTVAITYDPESRYWVATCEALGLVSEAPAYEALIQRVWQIAPELYALHGYGDEKDNFRLDVHQLQEAHEAIC